MRTYACILITLSSLTFAACGQADHRTTETAVVAPHTEATEALRTEDLVGVYRFEFTPDVRARYEAKIAAKIADPKERAKAMGDADEESRRSEIEFTEDHRFLSRVFDEEIFKASYTPALGADGKSIDLVSFGAEGKVKKIVFRDRDTIVLTEPSKGDLVYHRAQ